MRISANRPTSHGLASRLDAAHAAHGAEKHAAAPHVPTTDADPVFQVPKLLGSIAAQPAPLDLSRIATVRAAIADGSYRLDPAATADAITRHWLRQ